MHGHLSKINKIFKILSEVAKDIFWEIKFEDVAMINALRNGAKFRIINPMELLEPRNYAH